MKKITDATNGNRTTSYVMDKVGNQLSKSDSVAGTTSYVYDNNDRLLSETNGTQTTTYPYDAKGNTTSKTKGTEVILYTWNDEGRLVRVQNPSETMSYEYNENGIRVSSTINGVKTSFLLDSNRDYAQVLEEYTNTGVQVSYVYGHDLISQNRSGTKSFYIYDGLGTTKALTNSTGVVTDRYLYDAYGNTLSPTGTTQNKYLYTGEQFDSNLGQYYLRDRYYSQAVGRFTRADTFAGNHENPLSLNKYLYTHGNPVNGIDPSGLTPLSDFVRLYRGTLLRGFYPHIIEPWTLWRLVGGAAHRAIQADITFHNPTAQTQVAIGGGFVDVVLPEAQYYEIKPYGGSNPGNTQVDGYIRDAINIGIPAIRGTTLLAGKIYDPPQLPGVAIDYDTVSAGLIYYVLSPSPTGLVIVAVLAGWTLSQVSALSGASVTIGNFISTLALTKGFAL